MWLCIFPWPGLGSLDFARVTILPGNPIQSERGEGEWRVYVKGVNIKIKHDIWAKEGEERIGSKRWWKSGKSGEVEE